MTPEKTTEQAVNEKVGIGAYLSLAFAVVFFSGLCASSQWWGVFDFTTVNGGFGRLVSGVTEQGDAIKTAMANFRGKGGSGAIDGFMFALSLVPTVMFALAMITVFEHYGALKAARKILTPVLRPLIGSDKLEIIDVAKRIGTFEISSRPADDCCTLFMPRSPETHARIVDCERAERDVPIDAWVEEILSNLEYRDYPCPAYKPPRDARLGRSS